MIIWSLFGIVLALSGTVSSFESADFKHHLATKTPYRVIENLDVSEVQYEGCVPKKLWSVIRHGTRTPGERATALMQTRLFDIRDMIRASNKNCSECADFGVWEPHAELDNKKRLTREGELEMTSLAQRLRQRFPKILSDPWNNSTYLFRFTDTSRTRASARHFAGGLFGQKYAKGVWYPKPLKRDPILRFYKLCEKWRVKIKKNPQSLVELTAFLRGELFSAVVTNVTKRYNLPDGELDIGDVQLIYTTCGFETAWDKGKISPWCSVLSKQEFEILEYAEDLEYYWIDGYGFELTTQMGCVMLNDVFSHLESKSEPKAVFYFSHSGTILKFLSHLGLYQDSSTLRHDNFLSHRLWKTSHIDTFASNIAFVLFDCSGSDHVLTLHQEKPVILPGCPVDQQLCPFDRVERLYEKSRVQCDFEKICQDDSEVSLLSSVVNKLWVAYGSLKTFYFL